MQNKNLSVFETAQENGFKQDWGKIFQAIMTEPEFKAETDYF